MISVFQHSDFSVVASTVEVLYHAGTLVSAWPVVLVSTCTADLASSPMFSEALCCGQFTGMMGFPGLL